MWFNNKDNKEVVLPSVLTTESGKTELKDAGIKLSYKNKVGSNEGLNDFNTLGTGIKDARYIVAGLAIMSGSEKYMKDRHYDDTLVDRARELLGVSIKDKNNLWDYAYDLTDTLYSSVATTYADHQLFKPSDSIGMLSSHRTNIPLFNAKSYPFENPVDDKILYGILESISSVYLYNIDTFKLEAFKTLEEFAINSGFVITAKELYKTIQGNLYLSDRIEGYYAMKSDNKSVDTDIKFITDAYKDMIKDMDINKVSSSITDNKKSTPDDTVPDKEVTLKDLQEGLSDIRATLDNLKESLDSVEPAKDEQPIDIPIAEEEESTNKITSAVKNEVARYYLSHSLKETTSKYEFATAPLVATWFKEVNGVSKTELLEK